MDDTNPLAADQEAKRRLRKRSSSSDVTLGSDPSVVAALFDAPGAITSGVQGIGRGLSGLAGKVGLGGEKAADPAGITEPGNGGGFDTGALASNIGQAVASVGDGIGKVAEAAGDGLGHVVSNAGAVLSGAGAVLSGAGEVLSGAGEIAGQVLSTVGDVAGPAAEAAGEVVGGVLGALGDLDLN